MIVRCSKCFKFVSAQEMQNKSDIDPACADCKLEYHNLCILDVMSDKIKGASTFKCQVFVLDIQTKEQYIGILSVAPLFTFKVYSFVDPKILKEENIELGYIFGNNKFDKMMPLLVKGLRKRDFRLHLQEDQPFEKTPGCHS